MPRPPSFRTQDESLDEGDILADVPFVKWENGKAVQKGTSRGVVTSNGCACEDYERALQAGRTQAARKVMLQVAPLRPINDLPKYRLDEIEAGRQLDYFYVYGEGSILPDHIADLTREQPIPASVLASCKKIARLSSWQWRRLLIHLAVSRFHQEPARLFLPDLLDSEPE